MTDYRRLAYGRYREFAMPDYARFAAAYQRRLCGRLKLSKDSICLDVACGFGNFLAKRLYKTNYRQPQRITEDKVFQGLFHRRAFYIQNSAVLIILHFWYKALCNGYFPAQYIFIGAVPIFQGGF